MAQTHKPETIASLRAIPMFSGVSEDALESIASLLIERGFPKNKTIVEEGAPGNYMYIIVEGRVKVTKLSGDGREKILELLDVGDFFGAGETFGVVESVKAAADLFMPVSGDVTAVNEDLIDAPELINEDPYGDAWMLKIKSSEPEQTADLMDAEAYKAFIESRE